MISETEKHEDGEAEYFDQEQPDKEQASNRCDNNSEKNKTADLEGIIGGAGNLRHLHPGSTDHRPSEVHLHR